MDGHWKRTALDKIDLPPEARGSRSRLRHRRFFHSRYVTAILGHGRSRSISPSACCSLTRERGLDDAVCGEPARLPFADGAFDCVFIGYGLRNFPDLQGGRERDRARHAARRPAGQPGFLSTRQSRCCAMPTWLIYTRRARSGASCCTAVRASTPTSPIRYAASSPSTNSRLCCAAPATAAWMQRSYILGGIGLHWAAKLMTRTPKSWRGRRLSLHRHLPGAVAGRHAWYSARQFLPRLSRSLHRFPREPRRGARRWPNSFLAAPGITTDGLPRRLQFHLRRRRQDVPRTGSRPGEEPTTSWARACACGAGLTAGSARSRKRNSAPTSRPPANSPASRMRSPKMPRGRDLRRTRPAPWPKISCATACIAIPRRSISSKVSEHARPHRTDRTFTWKERDFDIHDATYRVAVTMLGNEVGELPRISQGPRAVDARLRAPALEERSWRRPSTPPSWWR